MNAVTQIAKSGEVIWNIKTRILHWLIAACVAANIINDGDDGARLPHEIVGYLVMALVSVRLAYGFLAKSSDSFHTQFKNLPLNPSKVVEFLKAELSNKILHYKGHNPLAAWTYIAIWLSILSLGVTGFMMGLDAFWGEEWIEEFHETLSNVLLALLAMHMAGMLKDAFKKKEKTWLKMIKGKVR